jgi:membrane protease YdiL (CAAX protease family)
MGHLGVRPIKDSYLGMIAVFLTAVLLVPALAQITSNLLNLSYPGLHNALALLFQQLLFCLLAIWHLHINLHLSSAEFGIKTISIGQAGKAFLIGIMLVALNSIGVWLGMTLATALLGSGQATALFYKEEAVLMGLFRYEKSLITLAILLFVVVVIAPLAEELVFRGYLYAALKNKVGWHAIWISSLLFTVVHFYLVHAIPVFLLALALTWLYERRGILWENVIAHATLNCFVALVLLMQR